MPALDVGVAARITSFARGKWGPRALGAAVLFLCVVWAYWPSLTDMVARWSENPQYSHGYLVPVFSMFLLWHRRGLLAGAVPVSSAWGVVGLIGAVLMALTAAYLYLGWLDSIAFLLALAALPLLLGGWPLFRWAWPAVAFLVFMLPLPYSVEVGFARPLQRVATVASTYVLQTLGLPALARGNTIHLENVPPIGVAEACSGLGMLITFCAFATAVAMLLPKGWLERVVILASVAPVAVAANVARIVTTGLLYRLAGKEWADDFFHHKAGWLMMPLALGMLWLELWVLSRLLVPAQDAGPIPVGFGAGPRSPGRGEPVATTRGVTHVPA